MTITEFLLARIQEDEAECAELVELYPHDIHGTFWYGSGDDIDIRVGTTRALAECVAKRAIIAAGPSECGGYADQDSFGWKHYPDPDWGHCDGCSAAESFDAGWKRNLQHLAAVYAHHADYDTTWATSTMVDV